MAKTKLSIVLIKENIPRDSIIRGEVCALVLPNGNRLYYKAMPERQPKWVTTFFEGAIPEENPLKGKSLSAVILYEIEVGENINRIFAVCFGYGRSLLNPNIIERRFGLLVTLNAVEVDHLRSIDINTLESIPLNSRVQSSNLATIDNFNVNREKDLLKSVAGVSGVDIVPGLLSGTDGLSLSTAFKYNEMTELLRTCYDLYKSERYKESFAWVDYIQAIKDGELINVLDNELLSGLNAENVENIWLSLPEIIDWDATESFRLRSNEAYCDIDINVLKNEYGEEDWTVSTLRSRHIKCVDANGSTIKQWTVYRCLYADISYNGCQYLLNDGKWFKVDSSFAEVINESYERIDVCQIFLPEYTQDKEKFYNEEVVNQNRERYCLMDRRLIRYGGSSIEFCDVYSLDKRMIHVKKYTGSSVLSHLFMQGLVSAENFLDKNFRALVNEKLDNGFSVPENQEEFSASDYEVVYAIAATNIGEDGRPQIPFFSKVALNAVVKTLLRHEYKVSIKGIELRVL